MKIIITINYKILLIIASLLHIVINLQIFCKLLFLFTIKNKLFNFYFIKLIKKLKKYFFHE